ncbi:hypothetical protein J5A56_00695 [Prevotella melaninogenica]|uniref:hypothetical protein n=1 Tax=Prevotella TaxID=838 RepID=UPI0003ACDA2D|nr:MULTISPECIES: hypothetical protein [Prevotella]ERJ80080.1 hypothetical protein HMPREF9148_00166 [Prevotella sp. F0091]QUB72950.1 hypothetical protein J5A56_00695 [Prevotella melaninogenica]
MSAINDILGSKPAAMQPPPASPSKGLKTETALGAAGVAQQRAENAHFRENRAVPTTQAGNISGNNTAPSVSVPLAPSIEQSVAAKGEDNETPVKAATPKRMSYVDMFAKLSPYQPPTEEELAKERKKEKREKIFAAISDGISALSNLYFTTKYAPNMYRHENSQSAKTENKWEKLRANRDAQQNAYIRNLMAAQQADDEREDKERAWMRQLGIDAYNQKKDADAVQYKKDRDNVKDNQWQKAFDQRDSLFAQDMEHKGKVLAETKRAHKANEGLKGAQIAEDGRHNRVSEAQGAARISQAESHFRATHNPDGTVKSSVTGKDRGEKETIRLKDGNIYAYSADRKGALTSLAPSMVKKAKVAAERYRKAGDRKTAQHYNAIAEQLEKTQSKDGIAAIVVSNIGDFPSMDSEVRSVLGMTNASPSKSTSSGGFNANNYRRNKTKPTAKQTTTNKPPLN